MPRRKSKSNKLTEKEKYEWEMERSLKDCKRIRIPEPTRFHAVGDDIQYGNWDWSGILEVLDDGKIYKVFSYTWHTNTNKGEYASYKIHYLAWFEFVPYQTVEEIDTMEQLTQEDDIHLSYQQRDIYAILRLTFDDMGFDLDPDYQREHIWTEQQKIDLIDSIFRNIDIGKFTIIRRPWGNDPHKPATPLLYEVLDGKQRITAIVDYFLNRFKYKGKYFSELCPRDRGHFKHYRISYAECEPLTQEQKYRYFLKLNTCGTPVDPNHIKKVQEMWEKEKEKK